MNSEGVRKTLGVGEDTGRGVHKCLLCFSTAKHSFFYYNISGFHSEIGIFSHPFTHPRYTRNALALSNPEVTLSCRLHCFLILCLYGSPRKNSPICHKLHFLLERGFILWRITCSDSECRAWWQDEALPQLGSQDSWFSTAFGRISFHLRGNRRSQMIILLNRCLSKWMWRKRSPYSWDLLTVLLAPGAKPASKNTHSRVILKKKYIY